jgi:hypothetical protein
VELSLENDAETGDDKSSDAVLSNDTSRINLGGGGVRKGDLSWPPRGHSEPCFVGSCMGLKGEMLLYRFSHDGSGGDLGAFVGSVGSVGSVVLPTEDICFSVDLPLLENDFRSSESVT